MTIVLILAAAAALVSEVADLDGLSHGSDCSVVLERYANDEFVDAFEGAKDIYTYKIDYQGHKAMIGYWCTDGHIAMQIIWINVNSHERAKTIFMEQEARLIERHGNPCMEWRDLSFRTIVGLWLQDLYKPEFFEQVNWRIGSVYVSLENVPPGEERPGSVKLAILSGDPSVYVPKSEKEGRRIKVKDNNCTTGV